MFRSRSNSQYRMEELLLLSNQWLRLKLILIGVSGGGGGSFL